jgi:hypothetical protein
MMLLSLDKVGDVVWHLLDLSVVELLELTEWLDVVVGNKIDCDSLSSETSRSSDSVNVVLEILWEIVVDDKGNLMDINSTSQKIGGDENTGRSSSKLSQDNITILLSDVSVSGGDSEVLSAHSVGEVIDLSSGVTEDDGLGNVEGIVQVNEGIHLPLLLLDVDVELLDTFKGELVSLNEDSHWISHELGGNVKSVIWHGGREESNLSGGWEKGEDVVDLILESTRKHLISLIEEEDLDGSSAENLSAEHVVDTSGGSDDDVASLLELSDIITNASSSDAGVALNSEVLSQRRNDLLDLLCELTSWGQDESLGLVDREIDLLQHSNSEGGSLSSSGLGLGDHVLSAGQWKDSSLLDSGWLLKSIRVDTTEKFLLEVHVIKRVSDNIVVRLEVIDVEGRIGGVVAHLVLLFFLNGAAR